MTPRTGAGAGPPRVLIAGGGVAALEACLALRAHATAAELAVDVLTPHRGFAYRPLGVAEAFGDARRWWLELDEFAADADVTVVPDRLAAVDAPAATVVTDAGVRAPYDRLLVAVGAEAVEALPGAVTMRSPVDGAGLRRVLDEAGRRLHPRLAFVVPPAPSWPVALYELALLATAELDARGARSEVTIVTPEGAPLELLGRVGEAAVSGLLRERGVRVVARAAAAAAGEGELRLADGRLVAADHVVTLPRVDGRPVAGLPRDAAGFIPVDAHGRVRGVEGVLAAGDVTAFALPQAGLAARQADAAAQTILAELGFPVAPQPFSPVLDGALCLGRDPAIGRGHALWWPPGRTAGRCLAPYLLSRAGVVQNLEAMDVAPVRVDVAELIRPRAGSSV